MIKPIKDRILVEQIMENETDSKIILSSAKEKPQQGKIIAVGDKVEGLNVGDIVVFEKFAGNPIRIDDKNMLLMKEYDIIAVIVP